MDTSISLSKVTAVLVVEHIEPVLEFWKRLGLTPAVAVPDTDAGVARLAFIILPVGGHELMYQTQDSVRRDLIGSASKPDAFPDTPQRVTIYVETSDLSGVEARLGFERQVMPRRTTFYGATEVAYADPAGNIIVFAQHGEG